MRVSAAEAEAALRRIRAWPVDLDPDERYRPVGDLLAGGLAQRVCGRLGGPLGGVPLRVGESAVVMGLAARLWSVLVVPAVRDDLLAETGGLLARDEDGTIVLGLRPRGGVRSPDVEAIDAAAHAVLDPVIAAVTPAPRLLWGNVAASLHALPRVQDLPAAEPLVAALLARPPYAEELELRDGRMRRRTCCLFYEVPGGGLCGDCVFDRPPA